MMLINSSALISPSWSLSNLNRNLLWKIRNSNVILINHRLQFIIAQFLTETLVLTGSGGLLGVLFGLLCKPIFQTVRYLVLLVDPSLLPPTVLTLEPRIALWSVGLSLFISLGVGLIFGVYPARRAAHMNPIDALRHE